MINISINGAAGKMGKIIIDLCLRDKDIKIVGLSDINTNIRYDNLPKIELDLNNYIHDTDVVIDFSSPEGTQKVLETCKKNKKPIVIGTTAHSPQQQQFIYEASKEIPIVLSPNMSLGVNLIFKLVEFLTKVLKDKSYDIEIIEAHHNKKKDAPSGTAKKIMEIIRKLKPEVEFIYDRSKILSERKTDEVGVSVIRAGDIIGEHTILFSTYGEKIEIKHTATSRETFAKGAILAAKWLLYKPAGLYDMFDVLQI